MCDIQVVVQCTILYMYVLRTCTCIFQRRYLIVTDALIEGVFPVCAMYKYTSVGILQLTLSSFVAKVLSIDNPHPSHNVITVNHVQWEGPGGGGEGGMGE